MLSVPLSWHDAVVGRAQHPDRGDPRLQRLGRGPAVGDRRPPRRDRREGPHAARGRGAGRGAQGARRGAQRADRDGHPRAAHAAGGRPRLHRPAVGGAAAGRAREPRPAPPPDARRMAQPGDRPDRPAGPAGRLDPGLGPAARGPARRTSSRSTSPGLLDEVVGGLRPLLRNHLVVVDAGIRRFALADPPRLRQIVEHLVENAVKYAPPGTTISVARRSSRASSGSPSRTRGRASRPSGASGSSSPTRGATRTPPAARGSACSPPSGWPNRWTATCGASRPSRPERAS